MKEFLTKKPYDTGYLQVSNIHKIYYEQSGNPKGIPAIYIYGGPGGCSKDKHKRYFNPKKYRIILMEQRGCGKARPQGEIKDNTTQDLVDDIEKVRKHLKIDKWLILGGSWGSTLALLYTEKYPKNIKALILRGIFACSRREINWLYLHGPKFFYPETYVKVESLFTRRELKNMTANIFSKFMSLDKKGKLKMATTFMEFEGAMSSLLPEKEESGKMPEDEKVALINSFKLEAFYLSKNFFIGDNQIILNTDKLKDIPGAIINGRYDMICPPITAYKLHKRWQKADFVIVPDAGHNSEEKGTMEKILYNTEKFSK